DRPAGIATPPGEGWFRRPKKERTRAPGRGVRLLGVEGGSQASLVVPGGASRRRVAGSTPCPGWVAVRAPRAGGELDEGTWFPCAGGCPVSQPVAVAEGPPPGRRGGKEG